MAALGHHRDVNVKLQVADQDVNKDEIKRMKKSSS